MNREVIVVGAGPAGSATAMALARQGHDVLLLDRQSFPRDKVCGDAVPSGAVEILYSLGMKERIAEADFYPVHHLLLSSPREYVLETPLEEGAGGANAYVVPRLKFDALLQEHAVDSGAEFLQGHVKEPIVEDGRVTGVRARLNGQMQELRGQLVIGADGVTSSIARALRPEKHEDQHRAVALRAYVENMDLLPHEVEFYLYKEILPGYAWIFPTAENEANIGLGMRLDKYRDMDESLEDILEVFMDMPAIRKRVRSDTKLRDVATWQLNFGSQNDIRRAFDGALLVGDAAGMINPLTGGGIHNSLQAAILAAQVAHEGLKARDVSYTRMHRYEQLCDETLQTSMRKSYLIQRVAMALPIWVDLLIRLGRSNSDLAQTFVSKL
ncbi:MAG: NAD(P)/FAD-dependent oxidoreductase [Candidatus Promineifilaceae bacterium]|nr:NAD(P)/FAD-dependent oxidoreductase [Candidatus Promineifilaceae bacterium]